MIDETFGERPYFMTAVDSSPSMIEKYRNRLGHLRKLKPNYNYEKCTNINLVCGTAEDISIFNASVVIVNLTMQFIKPEKRDQFIQKIYNGLNKGGILLLTEKIIHENEVILEMHHDFYKKFKIENGYSELEISRKRDSLENILIPETLASHTKRLKNAGFDTMDVWLKWFNFASMIAIK
ncbi:MAG: methyltransferase domain-containing protein [Desulfamplus sp.]|nr:methyltransferase domain-containing protein [Desulfamplus sp.]